MWRNSSQWMLMKLRSRGFDPSWKLSARIYMTPYSVISEFSMYSLSNHTQCDDWWRHQYVAVYQKMSSNATRITLNILSYLILSRSTSRDSFMSWISVTRNVAAGAWGWGSWPPRCVLACYPPKSYLPPNFSCLLSGWLRACESHYPVLAIDSSCNNEACGPLNIHAISQMSKV